MKISNNIVKNILKIALIFVIVFVISSSFACNVFADVGSFERYDSGGGSSFSSSSSSSSYDYDYDYDYSGSSGGGGSFVGMIIFAIIIIVVISMRNKKSGMRTTTANYTTPTASTETPEQIEARIKAIDPMFNKEKMESWAGDVFVKLQNAWTKRDWSIIRPFETNELFEQHNAQLQEYIDNNKINVMERICVEVSKLVAFRQAGDKDVLDIEIRSCMKDYIIDATTKQVLEGDKTTDRRNTYILTFVRKTGVLTKEGEAKHSTTNCPNCGAPTQVTIAGKCDYCGSIITTGEHDWVLSGLRRK